MTAIDFTQPQPFTKLSLDDTISRIGRAAQASPSQEVYDSFMSALAYLVEMKDAGAISHLEPSGEPTQEKQR